MALKRFLGFLHINLRAIALFLLLLVALYVVLARSLLALVPEYRSDLENLLSTELGVPLLIGSLQGEWVGFDPVVVIRDISLENPDLARIDEVRIRVAVFRSLMARELRLRSIQIDQARLVVAHQSPEVWLIGGEDWSGTHSQAEGMSPQLLRVFDGTQVVLANTRLDFFDLQQRRSDWRFPDLSVYYQGDTLHARGRMLEPGGVQPLLSFTMQGNWRDDLGLIGQVYTEFRSGSNLAALMKDYHWSGIAVQEVDASGRMWLDFEGWQLQSWQASLQLSELQWLVKEESLPPLQNLTAEVRWEQRDESGVLEFSRLGFEWFAQRCGAMSGRVESHQAGHTFYLDALSIPCVTHLVSALDLPSEALRERLEISEPEGTLRHIHLVQNEQDWRFDAELENVSLKAYESTPAGRGISGAVFAYPGGGGVVFDSPNFELAFPRLFLDSWKTRRGQGAVYWRLDEHDVEVYSDGIRLMMADGALVYGDFALRLNEQAHEDYLALQIALQDIKFKQVPDFVPYYAVGNDLHDWLRNALVKGKASSGIYVGYGAVEATNPDNSFTSSIHVATQNGSLRFADGWPLLEGLSAEIDIQNGQLDIAADSGLIGPTRLTRVRAHKPEVNADQTAVLVAKARSKISPKQLDYWLKESPIADNTRDIAEQITIATPVEAEIEIGVPMEGDDPVHHDIRALMKGAEVTHLPSRLQFKDVHGALRVSSQQGIEANDIRAVLFDESVTLNITSAAKHSAQPATQSPSKGKALQPDKAGVKNASNNVPTAFDTNIALKGKVSVEALTQHFSLAPIPGLMGGIDYQSVLTLPSDPADPPFFVLTSTLKGLARAWPAPFRKSVDDAERLRMKTTIRDDLVSLDVALESGVWGYAKALVEVDGGNFKHGWLGIQKNAFPNPPALETGLLADISVDKARLSPWLDFIADWPSTEAEDSTRILQSLALDVKQLHAFGYVFEQQKVKVLPGPDAWEVAVDGPFAQGTIRIPEAPEALRLAFSSLHLANPEIPEEAEFSDPGKLPALNFSASQLRLGEQDYGRLAFQIEPTAMGAIFRDLTWELLQSKAKGQLNWRSQGGISESILTLDVQGKDIDELAKHLSWKSPLTSSSLEGKVAWVWPAAPQDFTLGSVSGSLEVMMKNGRLKTADEKTGALRLFGIFNAEALGRRLKLDFSDLYKSGVSYDDLTLKARIDQGNLSIVDRLIIEGPSSKYAIKGNADLGKETLDMEMVVELPVSQNVPLAALLLGAPQIGGAVWLIDKLLGEPLSQITTARYSIKGPWKDPVLELKQVLNAKK